MLIDHKGKAVVVPFIANQRVREATLRDLREVPPPFRGHGAMFSIEERARVRNLR